jgi:transcriptional regulator
MGIATQPKRGRNTRILELREKGWKMRKIGKRFNISRARVSQILKKLSTGKTIDKVSKNC